MGQQQGVMVDLRERERVMLFCAAIALVFAPADWLTIGRFSWTLLAVRGGWAATIAAVVLAMRHTGPGARRVLTVVMVMASIGFHAALAALTGGGGSPLFHWMVAYPVATALLLQDDIAAIIGAGVALCSSGLAILVADGAGAVFMAQWTLQALAMTGLSLFASISYRRMRGRETEARRASDAAISRMRASEAAIAARDEFLAVAAHELRTPLTSLLLHLEAIRRGVVPGPGTFDPAHAHHPPERRRIEAVERQAQRLSVLIDGMLDVSRLGGGRLSFELAETDLAALVRDVAHGFAADAAAAGSPIDVRFDVAMVGSWDAGRLEQVFTNLIGNAIKYGGGAPIDVEGRSDDETVWISVRDRGIGIPAADQERIFRRFERAVDPQHDSGRQYRGLGLGLWISSELVKAFGGRISVQSTPGEGSTFTVELPRSPPGTASQPGRQRRAKASGHGT
jgi:signal transduction histidine kinase